ncbi:MAG: prepilin peptidase [bacterium]
MFEIIVLVYVFIFGAIFASFASAVAWRTGNKEYFEILSKAKKSKDKKDLKIKRKKYSLLYGRSMCTKCETPLPWWALIPIFSYIFFNGKCHHCKKKISIFYPMMEIVSGIFFVVIAQNYFANVFDLYKAIFFLVAFFALLILSFQDLWFEEISDRIALSAIALLSSSQLIHFIYTGDIDTLITIIISCALLLVIFSIIVIFTGAMGGGDLRAFAILGITFTFPSLLFVLTLSFIFASIVGTLMAFLTKKKDVMHFHVRLIPFLTLGFVIIAGWGNILLSNFLA